jgi:hypothetical protein
MIFWMSSGSFGGKSPSFPPSARIRGNAEKVGKLGFLSISMHANRLHEADYHA